jgi:hypothetical protein
MALPKILIDASFLYAVLDRRSWQFQLAKAVMSGTPGLFVIPDVVLPKTAFLFNRAGGLRGVLNFLTALPLLRFERAPLEDTDLPRARDIMAQYLDARFDFVDCCLMTLAERLAITQVCTLDRRDFTIFRPAHVDVLTILP